MAQKPNLLATDQLLRHAAERVLELAEQRAKDVLETAEDKAKNVLQSAPAPSTRWHIGKEIPLVLIAGMVLQTVFFVIWITQLAGNVGILVAQFAEFKVAQAAVVTAGYTREDARRDRGLIDQTDREFERRINAVEGRLDRVEHK
jgi:hypothetical protein